MRPPLRSVPAVVLVLLSLAAAPVVKPSSHPTTGPGAIDWSEAAKHVGETVTVTGPVKGTHTSGSRVSLNVGKDFPAADRFTIFVPFDADAAGGKTPDDLYVGKTVSVTGKIELYKNVPEIKAKKAADVIVQEADPEK